jgi:hypothetical protein
MVDMNTNYANYLSKAIEFVKEKNQENIAQFAAHLTFYEAYFNLKKLKVLKNNKFTK